MKVILLRDITKLGKRGDVKEVADGYATNVLIKKGEALRATPEELSKWKSKEQALKHRKEMETNVFVQAIDALGKAKINIVGKKRDEKGQLFAQVKEVDIVDAIFNAIKLSVDPKQIIISSPIKTLGKYVVTLKQGERKESFSIEVQ
jgi:large subunit ribosomal protein L9